MVTVHDMSFGYGKSPIFSNFDFSVPPGQVCLVTGINGVGKSTLLRLIAGVLKPQSGYIEYDPRLGPQPRRKIGFISDRLSLYENLRVEKLIDLHLGVFGVTHFDDSLIRHTRIGMRDRVRHLSVGQRTILHLSLILSTQPLLLLLDEVIHDLDAYLRKLFLDEVIRHLGEREMSAIFVNLNFHDIENLVDRVVLLRNGRIAVDEPIERLKDRVKRVQTTEALPQEIPCIFRQEHEGYCEYAIYPFSEEMRGMLSGQVNDLNLTTIVESFIGGEYV